ncbi:hypothetical protein [Proteiniclasticum sp. QWL-01]|uniref:hypothetical protein n=1 Tax=Proteiniclasticum sp. QWL-01 TaxID=3036945 RepID=UPI0024116715|nr:hypothetical protein [Proteiniclasticum sp. QWL-01]WFF73432.1 hypothetical protein P6M73_02985 [Proteiniclasticum sp. QWL-01]
MNKIISVLLIFTLLITGCSITSNPTVKPNTLTSSPSLQKSDSTILADKNTTSSISGDFEDAIFPEDITSISDPLLLQYVEDQVFAQLEYELDTNEYIIENVNSIYISKEYLDELAYNSKSNVYFGYTLKELDSHFEGAKYVFTLSENGQTIVKQQDESINDTLNQIIKNVAIGGGVILVSISISAVSAGMGAPVISAIFAAAASKATSYAVSGAVIGGMSAAFVEGYETKDFSETLKAGALGVSQGLKVGAITGTLVGGVGKAIAITKANFIHSARQSELDVLSKYGGQEQITFLNNQRVGYGTPAGTRPDIVRYVKGKLEAIEVKNYDLTNNRSLLNRTLSKEIADRVTNLPHGSTQRIVLDVRGRQYSESFLNNVIKEIQENLYDIYPNIPVDVMRY